MQVSLLDSLLCPLGYFNDLHPVAQGAKSLVEESHFQAAKAGSTFVGPQVLIDVNHKMEVMMEEVNRLGPG